MSPKDKQGTKRSHGSDGERDPKAEQLPYFHYRLHRIDAQPMLRRCGDFILRKMRQDGKEKYAVSVRWGDTVRHFPIQQMHGKFCFEAKCYRYIRDLIDFHINTGTPLTAASGARLERPKERQAWELLSSQIETRKQLGKGNFGTVYEATLTRQGKSETVAVKTLDNVSMEKDEEKVEALRIEMLEEARIMRDLSGHTNIVAMLGVTIDQEHPMAVMEIVQGSSLDKLLRNENLSMDTKLTLTYEAAMGIKYIHTKGYVHRDIAARNCLVEKRDGKFGRLKVTDFGLAKHLDETKRFKAAPMSQMPVQWSAIESLDEFVWTTESDIWSLGVLIWEILNDGAAPYNEFENADRAMLLSFLKEGKRLEIPETVPVSVGEMVKQCWEFDPLKRPSPTLIQEVAKRAMKRK